MNSDEEQQCNLHREPPSGENINVIMKHIQLSTKKAFFSQALWRSLKMAQNQVAGFPLLNDVMNCRCRL